MSRSREEGLSSGLPSPRPWNLHQMKKLRVRVLLVEDSADDVSLLTRALKRVDAPIDLDVVTDGYEALQFLRRANSYANAASPDLVLLDLNTPKKSGIEVLRELKADEGLKRTPVVILTTSNSPSDVEEAYGVGAACYLTKPEDFEDLKTFIRVFFEFWRMAEFPAGQNSAFQFSGI